MTDEPGFAVRTDIGRVRAGNEDRWLASPPVFAVADGMGGHQAGEVAAQLALDMLGEVIGQDTTAPDVATVVGTIERANVAIRRDALGRPDLAGMGTTCTVVVVGDAIRIAHVGDSRVYRYRAGRLERLTDDHSLVAGLVRDGIIDADAAARDGRRNIITRALGADDEVVVDVVSADIAAGDRLLLCTDGLHGQVADAAIAAILADAPDPALAADRLIELAIAAGGDDNVTVVVVEVDRIAPAAGAMAGSAADEAGALGSGRGRLRGRFRGPRRRTVVSGVLAAVLAVVLVVAIVVTVAWVGSATP